jgi:hypothetical protein
MWFKEPGSGLEGLNAEVSNYKKIDHRFRLFHGDLLHRLNVTDSIAQGIDNFDVLNVWDIVPGIAEMFHVVLEAFIKLLFDSLEGFCCRWMLVRALKVVNMTHS